jgi:hypothetical protein
LQNRVSKSINAILIIRAKTESVPIWQFQGFLQACGSTEIMRKVSETGGLICGGVDFYFFSIFALGQRKSTSESTKKYQPT